MLQFLEASAGADAASLVTTVTGMAGTMLSTMASNPILGIFVGVPIAGVVIGLVGRLMQPSLRFSLPPSLKGVRPYPTPQGGADAFPYVRVA